MEVPRKLGPFRSYELTLYTNQSYTYQLGQYSGISENINMGLIISYMWDSQFWEPEFFKNIYVYVYQH